jgi:xanthine/CO dehydrogenase XdhC/CoxF family maturation factor
MKELKDIVKAYDIALAEGKQSALATVVHLEGSSYRRPGARMLITDDGQLTGAISGGCLEGDALQKALLVMVQKKARIVTYDTMDEDEATLGVGLGCNGVIQVLIEPIDPADPDNQISFLRQVVAERQKSVLVTIFCLDDKKADQKGTSLLMEENGSTRNRSIESQLLLHLKEDASSSLSQQKSSFSNYISENVNLTAFIEYIPPVISVVVIGAGNDVFPLVDMAEILGWETRVVDGRASYASRDRFAKSCQVLVSKPENVLDQIPVDQYTVFLLMTHNYNYDLAILRALLRKQLMYIGVLGPKKKLDRMLNDLKTEGIQPTEEQMSFVYGPVGLDIGAETAEEIALSIITEIKAVYSGKNGQSLRLSVDVIHSREDTRILEKKIQ